MINLLRILTGEKTAISNKAKTRNFTDDEKTALQNAGLYEQICNPDVSEAYIHDAMGLASSMGTILEGVAGGHLPRTSAHSQSSRLIKQFKEKYRTYFNPQATQ